MAPTYTVQHSTQWNFRDTPSTRHIGRRTSIPAKATHHHYLETYELSISRVLHPRQAVIDSGNPSHSQAYPGAVPSLYTPTVALHASIVPATPTPTSRTSHPAHATHLSNYMVALVVAGSVFAFILVLVVTIVAKSSRASKHIQAPGFLRRCRRRLGSVGSKKPDKKSNGQASLKDDFDDSTWGTPTRFVYFKAVDTPGHSEALAHHELSSADFDPHENLSLSPIVSRISPSGLAPTKIQTVTAPLTDRESCPKGLFQERLHIEEQDIAFALSVALRDVLSLQGSESVTTNDTPTLTSKDQDVISPYTCPRADHGKYAPSSGVQNRPRQGSDASNSSQGTYMHGSEYFSPPQSSRSSMTSLTSIESDFDDDFDEPETVYEVKRAQTQSLEIKKGVLVALQNLVPALPDPTLPPKVIVSEPELHPSDSTYSSVISHVDAPFLSAGCRSSSTVSSLAREHSRSRGTLCSLETSYSTMTRTEGWFTDDGGFLQPPVPYLMVTRPSTSTILTSDSKSSSISIDLNDFPQPPSLNQPTYSKLVDRVQTQKRVWDNHSIDSTAAQKRSTVEQFIMMYETG